MSFKHIDFETILGFQIGKQTTQKSCSICASAETSQSYKIEQLAIPPDFRAWAPRHKEKGGVLAIAEALSRSAPGMTERAPSARVKLQYISEAFKGGGRGGWQWV